MRAADRADLSVGQNCNYLKKKRYNFNVFQLQRETLHCFYVLHLSALFGCVYCPKYHYRTVVLLLIVLVETLTEDCCAAVDVLLSLHVRRRQRAPPLSTANIL